MFTKALTVRSSVLIFPLPRIPIHRHPAAKTRNVATNATVIFLIKNISLLIRCTGALSWIQENYVNSKRFLDFHQNDKSVEQTVFAYFTIFSFTASAKTSST